MNSNHFSSRGPALVFGASGEEGRTVVAGLSEAGYEPVFAFSRLAKDPYLTDALGAELITGDLQNIKNVKHAFVHSKAPAIFLVTTTELPTEMNQDTGFSSASEDEFQVIVEFFHILKEVYQEDKMPRHVVMSTRENVRRVTRELFETTGDVWIEPLDDGSIVPHYSAKGRGGEYAMEYLKDEPNLQLTLLTLPFLYSNLTGFFIPLPNAERNQWEITACLGNGSDKIDMMGTVDLGIIVRKYLFLSYWCSSDVAHSFIVSDDF